MNKSEDQPSGQPFRDALDRRLRVAVAASVLINILLWNAAAAVAKHPPAYDLRPVEITRVIIDKKGRRTEKKITKKQILKKIAQVHKRIEPPKPRPKPEPHPVQVVKRPAKPAPTPPGAHNRVLIAKTTIPSPDLDQHEALAGGNAAVGKPTEAQAPGNAVVNPPKPPPAAVVPAPAPMPAPKPAPAPAPTPPPPPVKPPEPEPVKVEPPKPRGPSREAEPEDTVKPEIPDDLKHGDFRAFVRVKVLIQPDGSFEPILRTSSGNPEIDRRVLEALKRWKWKPALKDGVAVESTQLFKFEFEVD